MTDHEQASCSAGIRLTSICVYPVKGTRAVDLDEAVVEPWGLAGDRRWLLVDEEHASVNQRRAPALARVSVTRGPGTDGITVAAARRVPCRIPMPPAGRNTEMLKVTISDSSVLAASAGPEADTWFSAYLGRPVRLVYLDDPTQRLVDPAYGKASDVVGFADGYPILLTNSGSLDELNGRLMAEGEGPVPMSRFRPNVVVTGAPAWEEDRWRRIRIGDALFRLVKPCGRCVVTTVDQDTGERGPQPLKILARHRRFGGKLLFGQYLIPDSDAVIRAGDLVQVLET